MQVTAVNNQTLDVVIATYNRSILLSNALKSLLAATRPKGLSISVTVVDNNSTDNTRAVVKDIAASDAPFHEELHVWTLLGFIYDRHFCKIEDAGTAKPASQAFPTTFTQPEEVKLWS